MAQLTNLERRPHLTARGRTMLAPAGETDQAAGTRRRTLPDRVGYAVAAAVIGLGLFASVTPSPLYRTYSALWHFSPLTLTLIYATYAFGVLATLLLAGRVSDDVGRRPVLLVALAVLMASTVLFMLADSAPGCSSPAASRASRPAPR